jgi:hypothetical protein
VAERALLRRRVCRKRLFDGSHARQQRQQRHRAQGGLRDVAIVGWRVLWAERRRPSLFVLQDRIDYMIDLLLKWFGSCLVHESSSHASHSQTPTPSSNLSKTSKLAKKSNPYPQPIKPPNLDRNRLPAAVQTDQYQSSSKERTSNSPSSSLSGSSALLRHPILPFESNLPGEFSLIGSDFDQVKPFV